MTEQHWWCRVECDARLLSRKLDRRKHNPYSVSGYGYGCSPDGQDFPLAVLVGQLIAPTQDAALSQLLKDCPGGVVTTCDPTDPEPPPAGSRFAGLQPYRATAPLATSEELEGARAQMAQIEAHSKAHDEWMAHCKRIGRTDDEAAKRMHHRYPWPRPLPAYA